MNENASVEVLLRSSVVGRSEWVAVATRSWESHSQQGSGEFTAAGVDSVRFNSGTAPKPGLEAHQSSAAMVSLDGREISFGIFSLPHSMMMQRLLQGSSLVRPHTVQLDDLDTERGLHSYRVSVELRAPGVTKLPLSLLREYYDSVLWSPEQSNAKTAVFGLPLDPLPLKGAGLPALAWKTSAFSGKLAGFLAVDIAVEDEAGELFWSTSQPCLLQQEAGVWTQDGESLVEGLIEDKLRGVRLRVKIRAHQKPDRESGLESRVNTLTDLTLEIDRTALEAWFGAVPPALAKRSAGCRGDGGWSF